MLFVRQYYTYYPIVLQTTVLKSPWSRGIQNQASVCISCKYAHMHLLPWSFTSTIGFRRDQSCAWYCFKNKIHILCLYSSWGESSQPNFKYFFLYKTPITFVFNIFFIVLFPAKYALVYTCSSSLQQNVTNQKAF